MKSSVISIQKVELNYSSFIAKKSIQDIKQFKNQIKKTFSIIMKAPKRTCCSSVNVQFNGAKGLSSFATLNIKLVGRQDTVGSNKLSMYMVLQISLNKQDENKMKQYTLYLHKSLLMLGLKPKINTSIKGVLETKMNHNEQLALLHAMFQKLNGKVTEGLNEEKVISLSGYSKELKHYIISNNKKVYVQIASRYDSVNEQTVITIGNPIISMSY